jgi:hypothetical protein
MIRLGIWRNAQGLFCAECGVEINDRDGVELGGLKSPRKRREELPAVVLHKHCAVTVFSELDHEAGRL